MVQAACWIGPRGQVRFDRRAIKIKGMCLNCLDDDLRVAVHRSNSSADLSPSACTKKEETKTLKIEKAVHKEFLKFSSYAKYLTSEEFSVVITFACCCIGDLQSVCCLS